MQVWGNTKKHRLYYVPCVVVFKLKHYPLKAVNKDYESDVRLQQRLSLNSIPVRPFFLTPQYKKLLLDQSQLEFYGYSYLD